MRAIVVTAIVPPLLEVMSFARIERTMTHLARMQFASAPLDIHVAWWVDRALRRLPRPWANTCLRRASVMYYLLRSAGRDVELCIGVRRDEKGELAAHAWLVRDGEMYLEPETLRTTTATYRVIARFPSTIAQPA